MEGEILLRKYSIPGVHSRNKMDDCQMKEKFLKIFLCGIGISQLYACQATNYVLNETDKYVAQSVSKLSNKEVCTSLNMNYGPITKEALRRVLRERRLNCDEILAVKKSDETPEQREKRINEAIQLLNNAADINTQTSNQPLLIKGSMCTLTGQSRSGLYKNCVYSCGAGIFYKTISSAEICPLSATQ